MSFLEEFTSHLQSIDGRNGDVQFRHESVVVPALVRKQLLNALEKLRAIDPKKRLALASTTLVDSLNGNTSNPQARLATWQEQDRVVRFAKQLEKLLRDSFAQEASPLEVQELLCVAIERCNRVPSALSSEILTLELDRLSRIALSRVFETVTRHFELEPEIYANQIRAVRTTAGRTTLTSIGRVFLELMGRESIRWLLHVEAAQSIDFADPWRVSPEVAMALLDDAGAEFPALHDAEFPFQWRVLLRLESLGLIYVFPDSQKTTFSITPTGADLLAEIAQRRESPMSILSSSLIADMTLSATESATRRSSTGGTDSARSSTAAEATSRQARLVAHELRNTLVPVKTALNAMYRELLVGAPSEVLARRRDRIDRGMDATFRFIEQLVDLSNLAATPVQPFEPMTAIRDVLTSLEQETGYGFNAVLSPSLPPVSGHRARMVMALANILRNATQATLKGAAVIQVHAETVDAAKAIRITVEDNGPGVPEHMRRAIFDEGVSLRPGGSGLGLALVREVFEKEMKGLVACDASPLGGARFIVRIPVTGAEPL
ncbi:ATP-binding protein [Myxococcus sp. MISCRS1]|uniref:sensor histidine kinase n=1 Tax=Myxococcus sp. MISCRS1 TaxID=2996786 RepID=UPI00226E28EE|nr:ATP-binding protein [Myxococcus sp. MISCRS1]MCY0996686.1 ATP-binding protein [Myxococcus sp. MISCRS1]